MSLLAIDIGTTGCKAAVFRTDGTLLGSAYAEYALDIPQPGWAQLDPQGVWGKVRATLAAAAARAAGDPVQAISCSSLGEACVPVARDGTMLGPSVLCLDVRGREHLPRIARRFTAEQLYNLTGQLLANHYGLTKLLWIRQNQPDLYARTWKFLPWTSFVAQRLGAEPVVDYSLAERLLGLAVDRGDWATELLDAVEFDVEKLPAAGPAGTVIGRLAAPIAAELGLVAGIPLVNGCHDQCAVAVGCGALDEGPAACGLGTFICATPVFRGRRPAAAMLRGGLSTEHHPVPGRFVTLVYNQGGVLVRWFRDTFAAAEHRAAQAAGEDVYPRLFAELPAPPSSVTVVPTFAPTGPPDFLADPRGSVAGLRLDTTRGEILKGILEGIIFYIRDALERVPADLGIREFRAAGGGSRSDAWLQVCADILDRPCTRVADSEAGLRGAAILAGVGAGVFASCAEGARQLVRLGTTFAPRPALVAAYTESFARYRQTAARLCTASARDAVNPGD